MGKKKLAVITLAKAVAQFYVRQLNSLFGSRTDVVSYNFEDSSAFHIQPADLYVVSTSASESYQDAQKWIPQGSSFIISNITITKYALKQLLTLPRGTRALLVNLNLKMALEVIADLHHLGVNNIEFIPFYPFADPVLDVDLAITPDELRYVPAHIKRVINLGQRTFDASTIAEIAIKLSCEDLLDTDVFQAYYRTLPTTNYSLDHLFTKSSHLESQFDLLLSILDVGVIGVDHRNIVFACNRTAGELIGTDSGSAVGSDAATICPFLPFDSCSKSRTEIRARLIRFNGRNINVSLSPIVRRGTYLGAFAIIQDFTVEENKQHKLRTQLIDRGHRARYTFDDIVGACPAMLEIKKLAQKMAQTDLPILITGESGTGKELFAQAIHNSSPRREEPFVAVNCASIPDSLLESELFGYEEGAFTGAKKGGKLGLFEFAHRGTLLLDEIECMSLNLQVKLLRTIQEKEVMRVGGHKVIPVDVRLIAISNIDPEEMIQEKTFRKDLFYRLNTLPLSIPPLREREGDIPLLIQAIQRTLNSSFTLTDEAMDVFLHHPYPGNIRELRNYLEYLSCLGGNTITYDALPVPLKKSWEQHRSALLSSPLIESTPQSSTFPRTDGAYTDDDLFLLGQLAETAGAIQGLGRAALKAAAKTAGIFLSDNEIRASLHRLEQLGLVKIGRGRQATRISAAGLSLYHQLCSSSQLPL